MCFFAELMLLFDGWWNAKCFVLCVPFLIDSVETLFVWISIIIWLVPCHFLFIVVFMMVLWQKLVLIWESRCFCVPSGLTSQGILPPITRLVGYCDNYLRKTCILDCKHVLWQNTLNLQRVSIWKGIDAYSWKSRTCFNEVCRRFGTDLVLLSFFGMEKKKHNESEWFWRLIRMVVFTC